MRDGVSVSGFLRQKANSEGGHDKRLPKTPVTFIGLPNGLGRPHPGLGPPD